MSERSPEKIAEKIIDMLIEYDAWKDNLHPNDFYNTKREIANAITAERQVAKDLQRNRCEHCGANSVSYRTAPGGGCQYCGAPNCCPQCCKINNLENANEALKKEVDDLKNPTLSKLAHDYLATSEFEKKFEALSLMAEQMAEFIEIAISAEEKKGHDFSGYRSLLTRYREFKNGK